MGSSISNGLVTGAQGPITELSKIGLDGSYFLWPPQTKLIDNFTYDYIVVGGGTAGSAISGRLAESRKDSVLMLEAGGRPPTVALIASFFAVLIGSSFDYDYKSTLDTYAARGQNNFTKLTAGKTLGGSATLNHFIHTRGCKYDFDEWANISNDKSWSYDSVLPYFKKSERTVDSEIISKFGKFHGTDGPTGLTRELHNSRVDAYLKAFAELGNPSVLDLNADKCLGVTQPQSTIADGKRQTPAYTYLRHMKHYSNLHVSMKTRVIKIIFENKVAKAVIAVHKGKTFTFRARKEIILSAGVFNTPQVLMLSGIGPKEHLKENNIATIVDLPVGNNLKCQVAVSFVYKLEKNLLPIPNPLALLSNPLTIPFPVLVGSAAVNKSEIKPDYQFYSLFPSHDTPFLTVICAVVFGIRDIICDEWQKQVTSRNYMYNVLFHLRPKSNGTVRLQSPDPFADPKITTGYFTEKEDLEDMVKYVKDFIKVGGTKHFKKIKAALVGLDIPECADKTKDSDNYWKCFILNHAHDPYQSTSTCPIGKVVDSKLKVIGVKGLRVVDASVIPIPVRAAPAAAVLMLAEKGSDMIKQDNSN